MSELTIYGIPSCDTCRKARKWLTANGHEHRFHDLREDGIDIRMLERWAGIVDWQALLNTRSLTWRKVPEADRTDLSESSALQLMLDQPTLVKRPVLESGKSIAVGFSEDNYTALLGKAGK